MSLASLIPATLGALGLIALIRDVPAHRALSPQGGAATRATTGAPGRDVVADYSDVVGAAMYVRGELVTIVELQYGLDERGYLIPAHMCYLARDGKTHTIDNSARVAAYFNDCTAISGALVMGLDRKPVLTEHIALGRSQQGVLVTALGDRETTAQSLAAMLGGAPACEHPTETYECFNTGDCCDSDDNKCKEVTQPSDTWECTCEKSGVSADDCRAVFGLICPPDGDCGDDKCVPKVNSQTDCICAQNI